jgi:hypothetical protein
MDPEDIKLLQAIKAMGIKPKTDTPQDFERSMKEYFWLHYHICCPVCVGILRWKLLDLVA